VSGQETAAKPGENNARSGFRSRGGLLVRSLSYEATDPGSILGLAIFPG